MICTKIGRRFCEISDFDGDEHEDHCFRMWQLVVQYKLADVSEETTVAFMVIVILKEWGIRIFRNLDNVLSDHMA
jgi:hypothetical protein